MKKIISKIAVLVFCSLFILCKKEGKHQIRIKNDFSPTWGGVLVGEKTAGNAKFTEDINQGNTSEYADIDAGSFAWKVTYWGGGNIYADYNGDNKVSGRGKHKWTLSISDGGVGKLSEDK
ncbi:MAG: hypothetical protein V4635_06005 [Bacteroidota bacterium]